PQQRPKEGGMVAPHKTPSAAEAAEKLRRLFGPVPSINRGQDGLLNLFGQRATHNQLVTSTNVKDPVTDTFAFSSNLPVEAGEQVSIPTEQFTVTLNKFYATVPTLDSINHKEWHFTLGTPLFSFERVEGLSGIRSAAPMASVTGPLGRNASMFQS